MFGFFLTLALSASVVQEEPVRPNVLFLVIDDLNDWVGVLGGHPQARTPNIDRLAARGVTFTNAHCPSPVCIPSRTAVMTGIPPHVSGITTNGGDFRAMYPETITLPQHLRTSGYTTMGAGKIFHHNDPASFDRSAEWTPNYEAGEPTPPVQESLGTLIKYGALAADDSATGDYRLADWLIRELDQVHDAPFFLAGGFRRPHKPWNVPQVYFDLFPLEDVEVPLVRADDANDLPAVGRAFANPKFHADVVANDKWRAAVRAYLAAVAYADAQVGRVLDALDAGPNAENTIVVLWSDHGYQLGEKNHWSKSTLWEDATHVPLIFAGKGIPSGQTRDSAVGLIDIFRTVSELCGVEVSEVVRGHSLVPLLQDPTATRPEPVLITMNFEHAVRSDRWHYIRYHDGGEELYDVPSDPHEWTNLADDPDFAEVKVECARWLPEGLEVQKPSRKDPSKMKAKRRKER